MHSSSSVKEQKQDYNHVVNDLQDYMLTSKLIAKHSLLSNVEQKVSKPLQKQQTEKKVQERFFYPKEKDQLFWCYFIIQNGFSKYEYPGTTSFVNEKEEKFRCIEHMRNNKQQLRQRK